MRVFTEQDDHVAQPRGLLTRRACLWAVEQVRRGQPRPVRWCVTRGILARRAWAPRVTLLRDLLHDLARGALVELAGDVGLGHHTDDLAAVDNPIGGVALPHDADDQHRFGRH